MNALNKNTQAFSSMFKNAALSNRLSSTRIAIITPPDAMTKAGELLAVVVADVLARLWPNLDFIGSGAELQLAASRSAAASGNSSVEGLKVQWAPPYNCTVTIGCNAPTEEGVILRVGANGWNVEFGPEAICGDSSNPAGPAFAAAMVAARVFQAIFQSELDEDGSVVTNTCSLDLSSLFGTPESAGSVLELGETFVFGVGAVTHGLMWLLERWPTPISGDLHLVDQDTYGFSNGQRYAFMRPEDSGKAKVDAIKDRLAAAHPELQVTSHATDLNTFCAVRGFAQPLQRVVSGLDSAEARRHVALKLPERTVNMWTEGVRIGAGRYIPGGARACLACDYLERLDTPLDEVAQLCLQTGLRPDLIRTLLDSGRGLSDQEAVTISAKWSAPPEDFVGQPLRSVMPMLCATGKLQLHNLPEAVDVPFAFASLFAGIAGFMMFFKDITADEHSSEGWTQHIFRKPTGYMGRKLYSREECVCCKEMQHLIQEHNHTF